MVVDDPKILLDKTDALCTHALSTLLHYVTILEHDWYPVKLGLATSQDPGHAYMRGIVFFECRKI